MHDLDYPQGLNAEAICSNLVQLLLEKYEVHFMPLPGGSISVCARNTRGTVKALCAGSVVAIGDLMADVYSQMPEVKDEQD